MTKLYAKLAGLCAAASMLCAGVNAEGDAARGETVFKQCSACHTMDPTKKKMGPHLQNILGREAGSVEGAKYSKAMKASGTVWTDETLRAFLANPRTALPGTSMPIGLAKAKDMDDLIAYLSAATGDQ